MNETLVKIPLIYELFTNKRFPAISCSFPNAVNERDVFPNNAISLSRLISSNKLRSKFDDIRKLRAENVGRPNPRLQQRQLTEESML